MKTTPNSAPDLTTNRSCAKSPVDSDRVSDNTPAYQVSENPAPVFVPQATVIRGPKDSYRILQHLASKRQEYFTVLRLDARHAVIGKPLDVHKGTLNASLVHPREVFRPAILASCAAVIVAHNHPSGDPSPSTDDLGLTDRLVAAGALLGIQVLDHIIVTRNGCVSLRETRPLHFSQEV